MSESGEGRERETVPCGPAHLENCKLLSSWRANCLNALFIVGLDRISKKSG